MRTTADWLAALSARLGGASDYRIAMTLGVSRQVVSGWRTKSATIGDDAAIKIAAILDCDPAEILMSTAAERSKSADVRDAWQHALEKLRGVAAALAVLGFALLSPVRPAEANNAPVLENNADVLYYVKLRLRHAAGIAAALLLVMPICIFTPRPAPFMMPSFFRPVSQGLE